MVDSTPSWSHTIRLEATPSSVARARSFVLQHLVDHRLLHLADPVRLVASELATNALTHAQTPFSVTLSADDQVVLLTVGDDADPLPAARSAAQVMDLGGRRLQLVEMMSREWGVSHDEGGSKTFWASFAIG